MSNEQLFLIRYGLHNFVTHKRTNTKHASFIIKNTERQDMVSHALNLIKGRFGEGANVQMA